MRILLIVILMLVFCCNKQEKCCNTLASLISGLHPVETVEDSYPNGDGFKLNRYSLSQKECSQAERLIKDLKYMTLPIGDSIMDDLIFDYVSDDDEGWYVSEHNPDDERDVRLVLVNKSRLELIIFESYQ